jgi:hypothetical protein
MEPVLPRLHQNLETSWGRFFRSQQYRKKLAIECSKAVSSFLVPPENRKHRRESTLFYNRHDEFKPEKIPAICERAFVKAFDRFMENGVARSRKLNLRTKEFAEPESDGEFIGFAVQELLSTTKYAGMLAEAIVGPELKVRIQKTYGERASLRKAGVVFGLAAIVDQLGLAKFELGQMLEHWWSEWKHDGPRDSDLFGVVKRMILFRHSLSGRSKLTGQEWMMRGLGDDKEYAEQSCPDHVGAFTAYVDMAALFAEAVFVALCAWTSMEDGPSISKNGPTSQSEMVFYFPEGLGTPREMQETFLRWKDNQGRATAGSTFALMYNLKQPTTFGMPLGTPLFSPAVEEEDRDEQRFHSA